MQLRQQQLLLGGAAEVETVGVERDMVSVWQGVKRPLVLSAKLICLDTSHPVGAESFL